ncbi:NAD(P)-dependent alcohol dehydrogenase [Nonomuraea typhae]|uniref:NAD(P)-dependent alcohol dehydrogenase n=1 Tax=Nonomuraea typhae TaxID=2603600 RepID=UPI0012F85386|nr:NAD(P)-dependent alcohol dehydrogenase [Nonomuraea typhae]
MKAIVYKEYGPADVLRCTDVPRPEPAAGEVLVRVRASSVNYGDWAAMRGSPALIRTAMGLRRPKAEILGRDVAGVVEAVGPGTSRLKPGDRVCGESSQRAYAEYVAMPEAHLGVIPDGVTFEQAGTLPVAGTTAIQALTMGEVGAGTKVLVNGASGGVGTYTVQLAKAFGAHVSAVCSTRNVELVRSLGADEVIDYTEQDFAATRERYDAVLDYAGSRPLKAMRRILTPKGVYVASTSAGGPVLGPIPRLLATVLGNPFVSQRLRVLTTRRSPADLEKLTALIADGSIAPVIERELPLSEAATALRAFETEHAQGKFVLKV